MINTTDLNLFLNQVTMGLVQNDVLAQWLTNDNKPIANQGLQWDPDLIDQWMRQVIVQHPEWMGNA